MYLKLSPLYAGIQVGVCRQCGVALRNQSHHHHPYTTLQVVGDWVIIVYGEIIGQPAKSFKGRLSHTHPPGVTQLNVLPQWCWERRGEGVWGWAGVSVLWLGTLNIHHHHHITQE